MVEDSAIETNEVLSAYVGKKCLRGVAFVFVLWFLGNFFMTVSKYSIVSGSETAFTVLCMIALLLQAVAVLISLRVFILFLFILISQVRPCKVYKGSVYYKRLTNRLFYGLDTLGCEFGKTYEVLFYKVPLCRNCVFNAEEVLNEKVG